MRKKKKYIETEWDRVFDRDIKNIADFIFQDEFQQPIFIDSNYEDGIELITTQTSKDLKRIEEVLNKLKKEKVTGIDVESNCLHPWDREDSKILSVAIGTEDYVISFPVEYRNVWGKKTKIVLGLLEDFILESNIKISHNLKFELIWFNWYFGQDVLRKTKWADTMAQAYVNDERTSSKKGKGMFGLDVLCLINFGFRLKKLSKVNIKDLENELLDKLLLYNGMDSKYECSLCKYQEPLIVDRLKEIYDEHIETAKTLALTESNGVEVDLDRVKVISKDLGSKIKKIENKIYNLPEVKEYEKRFGKFNPNSNPNAVKIFKDILELKWDKRTKKKKHSVDEEVIKEFASRGVKLASLILEFRPLSKLKSTYVDGIPLLLGVDGKLHTNYNAMFTATSRTSSDNPNLQNFPSRKNREVRSIIVAPKDHWFVASDYKQLEARNIAAAANERCIIESDIHGFWADYICEMNPPSAGIRYIEDLTDKILIKFRKEVKNNTVFPLFFGSVKKSLEYALGLTERQAEKLYKDFWKKYPKVKEWQERLFDFIKEYGYVEMLSGRRRRDPLSINQMYNNPIQGTGADVKIRAMNRLSKLSYKLDKPWLQPILDVHDDLSNYIPDKELEEGIEIIAKEMVRPVDFMDGIPLGVEVSVGRNWADLEVVATFEESDFY
jgi:DNA polymerase-1